jgi:hypothetical protein
MSGGAFPAARGCRDGRFASDLRAHRLSRWLPVLCRERDALGHLRSSNFCRSTPGALAPVRVILSRSIITYSALIRPHTPTRRYIPTSPLGGLYEMPSLCVLTSTLRRPTSGSVLSLAILYRRVVVCDPGKFFACYHPVPSPMTLAFDH